MKVVIITYYWPPAGGSGVQRWLKFVKYLQDFNVLPVVYTVDKPNYVLLDVTLRKEIPENVEILKQPIWEPNNIFSKFKNKQHQTSAGFLNPNPSFFERKLQYIRANYFIPDARKYWVKPSVKYLSNYLINNKIDVIITTGPPHSLHLIGLELQKQIGVKWIADFRDPWTDIDYFYQLPLTNKSKQKHLILEEKVLKCADSVLVVGETMKENYKKFNSNIHVITNGFERNLSQKKVDLDNKFTITHIGMMNADRNPTILWNVLRELVSEDMDFASDLRVKLIGKSANEVYDIIKENKIDNNVQFIGYLPHQKVMDHQRSSQVLLLAVNNVPSAKGIVTGKIFEYLQAKRPVLAIAPIDGDLAEIIKNTNSGIVVDFRDKEKLKKVILELYQKFKQESLNIASKNIEKYHSINLTKQLVEVIKGLSK
jgi:glycosyltransferase involved in cell wall biosynthesis